PIIERITPAAAIPAGEIAIDLSLSPATTAGFIRIGGVSAHIVAQSRRRILAIVPDGIADGELSLLNEVHGGPIDHTGELIVAPKPAGELHRVANPAFDPSDGSLYVTRSGSRGEHVPVSLYRVTTDGTVEEFSGDITNPTAIAFSPRGQMFVTSR